MNCEIQEVVTLKLNPNLRVIIINKIFEFSRHAIKKSTAFLIKAFE